MACVVSTVRPKPPKMRSIGRNLRKKERKKREREKGVREGRVGTGGGRGG
jgi:hypothetical protein